MQKACMFDAEKRTVSTTVFPPLVTSSYVSTKTYFLDGFVFGAAENLSRLSCGRSSLR